METNITWSACAHALDDPGICPNKTVSLKQRSKPEIITTQCDTNEDNNTKGTTRFSWNGPFH